MSTGKAVVTRYQPDDSLPTALLLRTGAQLAFASLIPIVFIPAIVMRAAGVTDDYLSWAVFAAVAGAGLATMLQAVRARRVGSGHVLVMGGSGAFIAVSIAAVGEGGPALLATLVASAALFQFVLSTRLSLFRRVFTPTVSGTVIMLIPVTVVSAVASLPAPAREEGGGAASLLTALVTLLLIIVLSRLARGAVRMWATVIGVAAGAFVGGVLGLYDTDLVAQAPWIGLPAAAWPGLDWGFGAAFWGLLPGFLLVALISTIRTTTNAVRTQQVSWRRRAVDFRDVQGAVTVEGLSNLLAGVAGTVPNLALATGARMARVTGVAARSAGIAAGALILGVALMPKVLALVLGIPGAVLFGYILVLMLALFIIGLRMVVRGGLTGPRSVLVAAALAVGIACDNGWIFPGFVSDFAGGLFRHGLTAGGLVILTATLVAELLKPRPGRIETDFDMSVLPRIRAFLEGFATRCGWDETMADRLELVCEETLLTLQREDEGETGSSARRLLLMAYREAGGAKLEFVVGPGEGNLQDRIAVLGDRSVGLEEEQEMSLRLLSHFASSVQHRKYHDTDIVTLRVGVPRPAA